ncbi:hypothetical protein Mp_5g07920 [Marchantia polymorpha subsp. ruderalis]|uniref:Uncharacterized protein n=2 Tax=Marchantia polymorpha TaxID=3197 RepID=A0AAF6BG24_MARPO|nr:hypothetical protein MARPO_0198s0011 [Marchantia polymorpha]BBN10958.1 hypothetical protein Mp_5g07920 [Marchantia polymorpha subsp. ruderalis]|eukprot:PTQ27443.1 hypothetical protein MARPO_0198s0011 [Marchantia polymorpha]
MIIDYSPMNVTRVKLGSTFSGHTHEREIERLIDVVSQMGTIASTDDSRDRSRRRQEYGYLLREDTAQEKPIRRKSCCVRDPNRKDRVLVGGNETVIFVLVVEEAVPLCCRETRARCVATSCCVESVEEQTEKQQWDENRISKSHEDPMPDYISPELVTLIAQNAPSELEVFKSPIKQWSRGPSRGGSEDWQDRGEGGWIKRAIEFGIQELLHSGNGSNNNPRLTRRDARRSCPEATWSGYDTEDSRAPRAPRAPKVKNVKRKRPESLDVGKSESPRDETGDPVSRESASPIQPNPRTDQKDNHVGATADEVAPSSKSVGFTSSGVDQKREVRRPASAPAVSTSRYESDALNAKPWRHGMKKRTSTELKPTDTISCKRKAPVDPKKHFEVKKYMETKLAQQRHERQKQKARAEAAVAALKEKQRKLDLECQALLRS